MNTTESYLMRQCEISNYFLISHYVAACFLKFINQNSPKVYICHLF